MTTDGPHHVRHLIVGAGFAGLCAAIRDWNDALQRRMKRTVWNTGCSSWYLDVQAPIPTREDATA